MAVFKDHTSAWPETVAFKKLLRSMLRAQQYVPPQQVPPTPAEAPTLVVDTQAPHDGFVPLDQSAWTLGQNRNGDLIARHTSGAESVLLPNPQQGE